MHKKDYRGTGAAALRALIGGAVLSVCVLVLFFFAVKNAQSDLDASGLKTVDRAVRRAAVTCYALEGAYPESYAELKEHASLAVDEERYTVFYTPIAENLMPDITVVEAQGAQR